MSHTSDGIKTLQAKLVAEVSNSPQPEPAEPQEAPAQFSKIDEFALQDAIRRHESLVQLIYHTDRKAVQLIGIYFAIIGFVSTVSIANLKTSDIWTICVAFLIVLILAGGVLSAYRAQATVTVYLTGMKPDFWLWVRQYKIPSDEVVSTYLDRIGVALAENEAINTRGSRYLAKSYVCGSWALFLGVLSFGSFLFKANACHLLAALAFPMCHP